MICEGAGSPAEINLRAGDYVNMGLARHAGLPAIVVGDIDRGGVFASMFGTVALLDPADQALIAGFVINKFRGDLGLLAARAWTCCTGSPAGPTYGVLPWQLDLWLDAEDSLAYGRVLGRPAPPRTAPSGCDVAVVRLPRISNATDVEALATEPGVRVRLTVEPAELADADLVVLPGSKSTVADLAWLRETGLADAVAGARRRRPAAARHLRRLPDARPGPSTTRWRAGRGSVAGLGLLPVEITFDPRKTVRPGRPARPSATSRSRGYEIHHGYVSAADPGLPPLLRYADGTRRGRRGSARCTAPTGTAPSSPTGSAAGSSPRSPGWPGGTASRSPRTPRFAAARERTLDLLGDLVEEHLDTDALWRLIESGPPPGLPFIPPGAPPLTALAAPVTRLTVGGPATGAATGAAWRGAAGSERTSAGRSDIGSPASRQRLHAADHVGGPAQARAPGGWRRPGWSCSPAGTPPRSPGRSRSPPGCARRWPGPAATPARSGR